jgi:TonB family protein
VVPRELPDLFLVIAKHALRRDPTHRWSVAEIAARLNPAPLAAAAAVAFTPSIAPAASAAEAIADASPLSVPLSSEPAVPLAKMPATVAEIPARRVPPPAKRGNLSLFDYLVPVLLGAAVFAGLVFAIPKLFNFHSQPSSTSASVTSEQPAAAKPADTDNSQPPVASPAAEAPGKAARSEAPNKMKRPVENASPAPAPAVLRADPAPSPRTKTAGEVVGRGEVLNEVLPKPAQKALNTIHGSFHVTVKVQVDAAGNVVGSEFDSPGPSKYFAAQAEKAARQWQFSGAEANGHGIPSSWLIRFEFTSAGVHATAQQSAP